jgi:56kDa selenium binding protein (SBP56)
MKRALYAAVMVACAACRPAGPYLYVWAGDGDGRASDFLAVIDANASSPTYGSIVASIPTGVAGAHPHHTEMVMPENGHLLANGFHAGRTWLFDLTQPQRPRVLASFGDLAGYSHPHSFLRLPNGHLLVTFQYKSDSAGKGTEHAGMLMSKEEATGALVEMEEGGKVVRVGAASDTAIADRHIYPYGAVPMPSIDRIVSTTTDMNDKDTLATSTWIQFWKLSDLKLLKSIALPAGPRGDENKFTGEARLLADGKSVYVHTFNCGLYLVRDVDGVAPRATLVHTFEGINCGVPILTGHYWLQTVPDAHALVAMDISDVEHPREVSRVAFGDDEGPHWISIDQSGRRVVLNSAGYAKSNRLFLVDFDPASGKLAIDERFRDAGSARAGIDMTGKTWPHGFSGNAAPHGTVFSRQ